MQTEDAIDPIRGTELRRCIACERNKAESDFSLEHILPQAMGGGALCSDLFKTRAVCRTCNSTMGIFVDAPMFRNWIAKVSAAASADFVDLDSATSWVPFIYAGSSEFLRVAPDEILEIWAGHAGIGNVFHVHKKDDSRFDSYAGGSPIARRSDPGRAYLYLAPSEARLERLAIRSFVRQFRDARRYALNFDTRQDSSVVPFMHVPDERGLRESAMLNSTIKRGSEWRIEMTLELGFEQRFLAKVGRFLGFNLFGEKYLCTQRAKDLKEVLWEQRSERRFELMRARYSRDELVEYGRTVGVAGAYSVLLMPINGFFTAILTLPGGKTMAVEISHTPELWSGEEFQAYLAGVIYVIAPPVDVFLGPLSLPDFLAHRSGKDEIARLAALEKRRKKWPAWQYRKRNRR
jgi:hypothetical protein